MTNGIKFRKGKVYTLNREGSYLHGKVVKATYVPREGNSVNVIRADLYEERERLIKEGRILPLHLFDFFVLKTALRPVEFNDDEWE